MKHFIFALAISLTLTLMQPSLSFAESQNQSFVKVNGLVCDFCARALEKVFSKQAEVEDIDVDLDNRLITIDYKQGQTLEKETIRQLITDSGYDVVGVYDDKAAVLSDE